MLKHALTALLALALYGCVGHDHPDGGGCCGPAPSPSPGGPPPATAPQGYVYRCPMDGATRATPGPCPTCGMALDERHRVRQ